MRSAWHFTRASRIPMYIHVVMLQSWSVPTHVIMSIHLPPGSAGKGAYETHTERSWVSKRSISTCLFARNAVRSSHPRISGGEQDRDISKTSKQPLY